MVAECSVGPASFAQTRLYLDERVRFGSGRDGVSIYHIPIVLEIVGAPISLMKLQRAIDKVIEKHKVLRTRLVFEESEGEVRQEIVECPSCDLIVTTVDAKKDDLSEILYDEETNVTLFDLSKGRVFRCHAIRRSISSDEDFLMPSDIVVFNFHHASFDGSSIDLFFFDLHRAYSSDQPLDPCPLDYIDYSVYEKEIKMDEARAFWKSHLDGFVSRPLPLPYDRSPVNEAGRSGRGSTVTFDLSSEIVDQMLKFMAEYGVTLFQLGLAAFYAFLFKLTQETDLCVLTVSANRPRSELQEIIGFFVNTLPLRLLIDPQSSFTHLLEQVREVTLSTLPHAHLPYQEIVSSTAIGILQLLFDVNTQREESFRLDSTTSLRPLATPTTDPASVAKFDFSCSLYYDVSNRSVSVTVDASSDLFLSSTVESIAGRFQMLFNQVFSPSIPNSVCQLTLVLPHEVPMLDHLNHGDPLVLPRDLLPIHQQFACQANEDPQKLAVILDDQSLTYAEVFHRSQLVACHLIDECQVQSGDRVGQCVQRSIEMLIGMMGILFSGASYLPLSPDVPAERLHLFLELTKPRCVLLHSRTKHLLQDAAVPVDTLLSFPTDDEFAVEPLSHVDVSMEDIAFFIFTSGSTGVPKVVPISQLNFIHLTHSYNQAHVSRHKEVIIQMASCSFDVHVEEHLGTLIGGSLLVLLRPQGNLDAHYLYQTIEKTQATVIDFVPTSLAIFCEYLNTAPTKCLSTLKLITVGGEQLPGQVVRSIFNHLSPGCSLLNIYAPAECTVSAVYQRVESVDGEIPIGRCLPGRQVALLDTYGQPVIPDGRSVGELYLGGVGVFGGYLNRPEDSARVLVRLPNRDGVFYRTGDLGKINARGQLIFTGRVDFQIKLRGQRIELSEIEAVLTNCAVVKVSHAGEEYLVAYVQTKVPLDVNMLHEQCAKKLPLYMIPSFFVPIDALPLNSSGKLDRSALPPPDFSLLLPSDSNSSDEHLRTDIERRVASIWCGILHRETIPSTTMSFFRLGGNSLLLIRLNLAYQREFQQSLNIGDLFRSTTMVDHIRFLEVQNASPASTWHTLNISEGPASYAQQTVWLAERTRFIRCSPPIPIFNMPMILRIDSGHLSIERCLRAITDIIAVHSIFRTRLAFDVERGILFQSIGETHEFPFRVSTVHDDEQRALLLREELWTPFDTEHEGVFRCHFIRYHHDGDLTDRLAVGDLLVFYFHHGSFDGRAMDVFLDELQLAYVGEKLQPSRLQYIDYSSHERTLPMAEARTYWRELLQDYAWDRQLHLGSTKRVFSARRSGRGSQLSVAIPSDIVRSMINCAHQLDVTLFQLGLTCFYLFLTEISPGNRDACIGVIHLNRYRPELASMIGMFVNILPCRISNASLHDLSFAELLRKVQKTFLASVQHAHLPYDELLNLHRVPTRYFQFPFLQTLFSVDTSTIDYTNTDDIRLGDTCHLSTYKTDIKDHEIGFKFDLDFSFAYDVQAETIDCLWAYMLDVFEPETIEEHSRHFIRLLTRLFGSTRAEQLHLPLDQITEIDEEKSDQWKITRQDANVAPPMKTDREQELVHRIRAVFSRVLGCTMAQVDVNRSFFEQGGTSLKALQAVTLLKQDISSDIDANLFFDSLSVSQLARATTKNDLSLYHPDGC